MKLKPLEGSRNIMVLPSRGNRIAVASVESQDAIRGFDFSMAHLSEVAFWRSSDKRSPEDFLRTIAGSILYAPETLIVMESTANGTGNYFHREWLRSVSGQSDKEPLFIPWHDIEIYSMPVVDPAALWESLDEYEKWLWDKGCTLEQINWYRHKRAEYPSLREMMAEFPTTPAEAFAHSASNVFAIEHIEKLRETVTEPVAVGELESLSPTGPQALENLRFASDTQGAMKIWEFPATQPGEALEQRYVVGVDIGGVGAKADFSVISVMDCGVTPEYMPRIVAQWRGHIYHDMLAWKCAAIARWYCNALLVIESNTLETEHTDGDPSGYILDRIAACYPHIYYRTDLQGVAKAPGMHINRATKTAIITSLVAAVRDRTYIERDPMACDEYSQYERRPNGSFGAREGCHDDILMTRALIIAALPSRHPVNPRALHRFLGKKPPQNHAEKWKVGQ